VCVCVCVCDSMHILLETLHFEKAYKWRT
jgi:hypothetical protein